MKPCYMTESTCFCRLKHKFSKVAKFHSNMFQNSYEFSNSSQILNGILQRVLLSPFFWTVLYYFIPFDLSSHQSCFQFPKHLFFDFSFWFPLYFKTQTFLQISRDFLSLPSFFCPFASIFLSSFCSTFSSFGMSISSNTIHSVQDVRTWVYSHIVSVAHVPVHINKLPLAQQKGLILLNKL